MRAALATSPRPPIEERLRGFLMRELKWDPAAGPLDRNRDLIGNGELDSIGVFRVIAFAEAEFGIEIRDDEIRIENFESLHRIAHLVQTKLAG